jgi:hypothetical protein
METYAHSFFTWALAKHGVGAGRGAGIAGAVGVALPDVPSFAAAVYFWGQRDSMPHEELLDAIYFHGPFGGTGSALHSVVPVGFLLGLYALLGLGRFDRRRILLWFLLGWAGHAVADFLTHGDDARPLFWTISGWKWSSPVSYYNPLHYGREFMVVEHASMLAIIIVLFVRRLRGREKRGPKKGPRRHAVQDTEPGHP